MIEIIIEKKGAGYLVSYGGFIDGFFLTFWGAKRKAKRLRKRLEEPCRVVWKECVKQEDGQ